MNRLPVVQSGRIYKYGCTTQQLEDSLEHIQSSGDTIMWPVYLGGHDWLLFCQRGDY